MPEVFIETERALISGLISGGREIQEWVSSELSHKDFQKLDHQKVYKAVVSILDDGLEVNKVSVKDRSRVSQSCIDEIMSYGPQGQDSVKTFIKDIKDASGKRFLDQVLTEAKAGLNTDSNISVIIEGLESKLYGGVGSLGVKDCLDAHDVARAVAKTLQDRVSGKGEAEVSTGLKNLDKAILGLRQGKNIVLGARPGMGKSALAGTVAKNVVDQGYGVIIFSAEMLEDEIMERSISQYTDVNARKIASGKNVSPEELNLILNAPSLIKPGYLKLNTSANTLVQIRRIARIEKARMARKGIKLAMVIVDYLQLYTGPEESAISDGSRHCKLMAQELGVSVMTLSQLNRGVEHREDRRPLLSDLRGSGTIEQDADVVLFLFRPGYYPDSNCNPEETECLIAKQRGGPTGTVYLLFKEKQAKFVDNEHVIRPSTKAQQGVSGVAEGEDSPVPNQEPKAEADSAK